MHDHVGQEGGLIAASACGPEVDSRQLPISAATSLDSRLRRVLPGRGIPRNGSNVLTWALVEKKTWF